MIEIQAPDGSIIQFPDGTPDATIEGVMQENFGTKQAVVPQDSTFMDTAKGVGAGLAQGAASMISAPAQVGNWLGEKVSGGVDRMLGYSPEEIAARRSQAQSTERQYQQGSVLPDQANVRGPEFQAQSLPGQYAQTVAQFLPGTVIGGPAGMGAKLLGATAGGLGSETAGQATKDTAYEPYARLAGGLLGGVAPAMGRRLVTPLPVSKERAGLLQVLKKEGVPLTGGQASGRQGLRYAESELGGGKIAKLMEEQGEAFTKAALKRVGTSASRATPEVIDKTFDRVGGEFNRLSANNRLIADPQIAQDLTQAAVDYGSIVAPNARAPVVEKMINDTLNLLTNQGFMAGKTYQHHTSRLRTIARNTKDPELKSAVNNIVNALDSGMERTIAQYNPGDLGAWKLARKEYRNLMVIEQAATAAGEKAAEGLISPSALRNATIQKHGRRNYARGSDDFADLARAGEATMKPLPQSGTAPRTAARNIGVSLPALLGGGAGATVSPEMAMLGMLGGAGVPYAMGRGLLSKPMRKYLSNQRLGKAPISVGNRAAIGLLGSAPQLTYGGQR